MNYRRYYLPDTIVFITQVVAHREPVFAQPEHMDLLREILREAQSRYPFIMHGFAFLPEHFHLLIRPSEGVTHSQVMHSLKPNFTKAYAARLGTLKGMRFWQQRYWDHVIRDEVDFERHLHYIHYNPVRHGLATKPEEYAHTSYAAWRERGAYPEQWGWRMPDALRAFPTVAGEA